MYIDGNLSAAGGATSCQREKRDTLGIYKLGDHFTGNYILNRY